MRLVKVDKKSFLKSAKEFKNLPISFNPELKTFLEVKNFSSQFFIIIDKNKCIGLLPTYKKNKTFYSVPYFSYGLVLNIPATQIVLEKIHNLMLNNLTNFNIKLFGKYDDVFKPDKITSFLYLKNNVEDQLTSFNSKLRSQIKKGYKNNLKCQIGGKEFIYDFWKIYSVNLHSMGSPSYSIKFFNDLFDNYDPNQIKIFIIKHDSITIGSSLFLSYNGFSEVILASTLKKYNFLSTNMMMYWEMISYAINNKNSIFSFGRSDLNSSQLRFKKQWGVEKLPILYLNSNETLFNLKILKIVFSRIWNFIPYSIAKRYGHYISEKFY